MGPSSPGSLEGRSKCGTFRSSRASRGRSPPPLTGSCSPEVCSLTLRLGGRSGGGSSGGGRSGGPGEAGPPLAL